mgnify:CR=1 FL=1
MILESPEEFFQRETGCKSCEKLYGQSNVSTRKTMKASPKQNPAIAMKAWRSSTKTLRKSICWEDKRQKLTKKKEWIQRSHTFPCDLNLYLIVNHDNPLSTAGASAKALYNRHQAEFHYCYLKSATDRKRLHHQRGSSHDNVA